MTLHALPCDCRDSLVGKAPVSRAGDMGIDQAESPLTEKLVLLWLLCQAPYVAGSVIELVGPVSVYCDWVR